MSLEQDNARRSAIRQRSARVLNVLAPIKPIESTRKQIHVDPNQRSGEWVRGSNVEPLYRLKAKLPGDAAVRFAAIVIVILIIAYK